MTKKVELGYRVKHKINGFSGIVTSVTQYLTGCDHAGVSPEELDKDGKPVDVQWFDVNMLEVFSDEPVIQRQSPDTGGPQDNPPQGGI